MTREEKFNELNEKIQALRYYLPKPTDEYLYRQVDRVSASTLHGYMKKIRDVFKGLSELDHRRFPEDISSWDARILNQITRRDIDDVIRYFGNEKGLTDSTCLHMINALNGYFDTLVSAGIVKDNPVRFVKRPHLEVKEQMDHLSPEEEELFLQVVVNELDSLGGKNGYDKHPELIIRDQLLCLLPLKSGLTTADLEDLSVEDYIPEVHGLRLNRKGKTETIYLSQTVEDKMNEYLSVMGYVSGPMFRSSRGTSHGERMGSRGILKVLRTIGIAAGFTDERRITPQILRATYISNLIKATGDLSFVKNVTGQRSMLTIEKYDTRDKEHKKMALRNILG